MYEFVTGPLAWLSFCIFFIGLLWRLIWYIKGLNWQIDRVSYGVNTIYGIKGAIRSIFYWLLPFGTRSWRFYPGFTIIVFVFHICLLITPIFLLGHNLLVIEKFGIGFGLWTLSESFSDIMTIALIIAAFFLIMRRIALPEVRIITDVYDFSVICITIAPFITGFFAYHQIGNYNFWLILHIICGEIMLISIPFTKLSHFLLFFLSRGQLGMDYGIKRGGMKNKGLSW